MSFHLGPLSQSEKNVRARERYHARRAAKLAKAGASKLPRTPHRSREQMVAQRADAVRMAGRPQGLVAEDLRRAHGLADGQIRSMLGSLLRLGHIVAARSTPTSHWVVYFASAELAAERLAAGFDIYARVFGKAKAAPSVKLAPAGVVPGPASAGVLVRTSRGREGGNAMGPVREQAALRPSDLPAGVQRVVGWACPVDTRYQVPPGVAVEGAGFARAGIGRDITTGNAWGR